MIGELELVGVAGFMHGMTRVAAHVQRRVPASFFGNVEPGRMTVQAKIFLLSTGERLQQLFFVGGLVRVMALDAVADRRWVHATLTCAPLLLSSWHSRHLAASVFGSRGTGCTPPLKRAAEVRSIANRIGVVNLFITSFPIHVSVRATLNGSDSKNS
jgi:hypothetical protein